MLPRLLCHTLFYFFFGRCQSLTDRTLLRSTTSSPWSPSFSFDNEDLEWSGVVLLFDDDWILRDIRRGLLRDLNLLAARRTSDPVDEE